MAWTPISNTVPQYSKDADGVAASNYYIKLYASGTTTPINMASASDGSGLLAKCQLDTLGYPINGSSDVFVPHIDQAYKLALYENATDADNNALGSAAWVVDGLTIGDSGLRDELIASNGTSLITHTESGTDYNLETYLQNRHVTNVKDFGAVGDGVADDTNAIATAVALGSQVYFPAGTYLTDQIVVTSNTMLVGDGIGSTTLKLNGNVNNNLISINTHSDIRIENMTLNQNRDNQTAGHGIRLASVSGITIDNVRIINAYNYGIGAQVGTIEDVIIQNVDIDGCGADGIDFKNHNDNNANNVIDNVTIKNIGIGRVDKTGIDVRGPVMMSNIYIELSNASSHDGIRFRPGELGATNGLGGHHSSLTNFEIVDTGSAGIGLYILARDVKVSNGVIRSPQIGVQTNDINNKISNVTVLNSNASSYEVIADDTTLVNCQADSSSAIGFDVAGANATLTNCYSTDNTTHGIRIQSSATNCRVFGGKVNGNTPEIGISTGDAYIMMVDGYKTEFSGQSSALAIDSVGDRSFAVTHNLPFTPQQKDVQMTLAEATGSVADFSVRFLKVTSITSSEIRGRIYVDLASATAGATVAVNVNVQAYRG